MTFMRVIVLGLRTFLGCKDVYLGSYLPYTNQHGVTPRSPYLSLRQNS